MHSNLFRIGFMQRYVVKPCRCLPRWYWLHPSRVLLVDPTCFPPTTPLSFLSSHLLAKTLALQNGVGFGCTCLSLWSAHMGLCHAVIPQQTLHFSHALPSRARQAALAQADHHPPSLSCWLTFSFSRYLPHPLKWQCCQKLYEVVLFTSRYTQL